MLQDLSSNHTMAGEIVGHISVLSAVLCSGRWILDQHKSTLIVHHDLDHLPTITIIEYELAQTERFLDGAIVTK